MDPFDFDELLELLEVCLDLEPLVVLDFADFEESEFFDLVLDVVSEELLPEDPLPLPFPWDLVDLVEPRVDDPLEDAVDPLDDPLPLPFPLEEEDPLDPLPLALEPLEDPFPPMDLAELPEALPFPFPLPDLDLDLALALPLLLSSLLAEPFPFPFPVDFLSDPPVSLLEPPFPPLPLVSFWLVPPLPLPWPFPVPVLEEEGSWYQ